MHVRRRGKTWENLWVHTLGPPNKSEAKRRNAREPLGAHIRSFECADPIRSRYCGFWVRFWLGNLTNSLWLDQHVQRTQHVCPEVPSHSASPLHLFALCSFMSKKTSGFLGKARLVFRESTCWWLVTIICQSLHTVLLIPVHSLKEDYLC